MEKTKSVLKCPVTGLEIFEDPKWINIPHKNGYQYTFKKIGESIVFTDNAGDMKYTDMTKYHELLEAFIQDAGIIEPFVEFRSFKNLTGKPPASELKKQQTYIIKNQSRMLASVLYGMPLLLRLIASSGAKANPTPIKISICKDYESGIIKAINHLKPEASNKTLIFDMLEFKETWTYKDKNSDISYKTGIIPEKVILSIIKGSNVYKENVDSIKAVLEQVFEDGNFENREYIRIADYTEFGRASIISKKHYASIIKSINKKYNTRPSVSYICGANPFIKTTVSFFSAFLNQKIVFVDTIATAFEEINKKKTPRETKKTMEDRITKVNQKDIDEINTLCGCLLWEEETFKKQSPYEISKDNPLYKLQYALSVIQDDIFEIRRREKEQKEKLQKSMEEAQIANKAKAEFLTNITHELLTPLNGIIGTIDLLHDTDLSEEQQEFAEMSKQSSGELLNLVTDILNFSKIETGDFKINNINFDLEKLIQSIDDDVFQRAREKLLGFQCNINKNVPTLLKGDPDRLYQIISTLADNAVKFTEKGTIFLQISIKEEEKDNVTLVFEIIDPGIGIDTEKQSTLFDLFTQADGSSTRQHGGTGLGLAISKQLTELMGGSIGVKPGQDNGSNFWFEITFEKQIKT